MIKKQNKAENRALKMPNGGSVQELVWLFRGSGQCDHQGRKQENASSISMEKVKALFGVTVMVRAKAHDLQGFHGEG